jgi:hypothetical protein
MLSEVNLKDTCSSGLGPMKTRDAGRGSLQHLSLAARHDAQTWALQLSVPALCALARGSSCGSLAGIELS